MFKKILVSLDGTEPSEHALEVGIDEDVSTIIARRQPAAGDLRMLLTVVKTITDLERIGDEADKIARMAKLIYAKDRLQLPRTAEIRHMSQMALQMLRNALDGFARLDLATMTCSQRTSLS